MCNSECTSVHVFTDSGCTVDVQNDTVGSDLLSEAIGVRDPLGCIWEVHFLYRLEDPCLILEMLILRFVAPTVKQTTRMARMP